jgi:hypothetical protein
VITGTDGEKRPNAVKFLGASLAAKYDVAIRVVLKKRKIRVTKIDQGCALVGRAIRTPAAETENRLRCTRNRLHISAAYGFSKLYIERYQSYICHENSEANALTRTFVRALNGVCPTSQCVCAFRENCIARNLVVNSSQQRLTANLKCMQQSNGSKAPIKC